MDQVGRLLVAAQYTWIDEFKMRLEETGILVQQGPRYPKTQVQVISPS